MNGIINSKRSLFLSHLRSEGEVNIPLNSNLKQLCI